MASTKESTESRATRAALRGWWKDGLEAAIWLCAAVAVAFFITSGGLLTVEPIDHVYSAGRIAGLVATVLVLSQVLLISRAPWVERAAGHDRTTLLHTKLGKIAFIVMLFHVGLITAMTAYYDNNGFVEQLLTFSSFGWFMLTAQIGFALFAVIVATSLMIVRRRWRYESWYAVHVFVYVAIALVVPHQFLEGTTLRTQPVAWWFWLSLYAIAFGSLLIWRFARPLWRLWRHDLRVTTIEVLPDGSRSITMSGRGLDRWKAQAGQFFLWRFLDSSRWRMSHPFSLSAAPSANQVRITVKPSGDFTKELSTLAVGTRVMADGPLGTFSQVSRSRAGLVLAAAGIGVTPIRAMLEEFDGDEQCTVILRMVSEDEAPLLEEMRELATRKGAALHVLFGRRQDGWVPAGTTVTLAELAPDLAQSDVYICGPVAWAELVEQEALECGCAKEAIHREQFAW